MPAPRFSAAQEQQVRRDYEAQMTENALLEKWDCSRSTFLRSVRRAGGTVRPMGKPKASSAELEQLIRAEYDSGARLAHLTKKHQYSRAFIGACIKRAGGQLRDGNLEKQIPESIQQKMIEAYQSGLSAKAAGAMFGLSSKACINAMLRAGVPLRRTYISQDLRPEDAAPMSEMYLEGHTTREVADRFGYRCLHAVRLALKRTGTTSRHRRLEPQELAALIAAYKAGQGPHKISQRLQIHSATVFRVLKRHGHQSKRPTVHHDVNHGFFSKIDTEEKAWLLGFLSADGNVRADLGCVQLDLQMRDRECVETIKRILGYTGPILERKPGRRLIGNRECDCQGMAILHIYSRQLARDLNKLGVTPRKSKTLMPWKGPRHLMRHYARGLVDGDGTICVSRRRRDGGEEWTIGLSGTYAIVKAFLEFVKTTIGKESGICLDSKPHEIKGAWVGGVSGTLAAQQAARILYDNSTVFLARKKGKALQLIDRKFPVDRWAYLTPRRLAILRAKHGSWGAAARALGMREDYIIRIRRRLGMAISEC